MSDIYEDEGPTIGPKELISLAHRIVVDGESPETLAREHKVSKADLMHAVRELNKATLIPGLQNLATSFRLNGVALQGRQEYPFKFPEIKPNTTTGPIKFYKPDVAWFAGQPSEDTATVIFEIEDGTSPKHQMGGVTLANILALKYGKPMWFFAIVPEKTEIVSKSIALCKRYLESKWALNAHVIHDFNLRSVEESVRKVLYGLL